MTRETRIGLLVGLMFIIAFGLILSELTGAGSKDSPRTAETPRRAPDKRRVSRKASPPARDGRNRLAAVPRRGADARDATNRQPAEDARRRSDVEELDLEQWGRRFPPDQPAGREPPRRRVRYYVVQRGDNLTKIARKTLNDTSRAAVMKIYNANRDKLTSPDNVPVGVKLVIPR